MIFSVLAIVLDFDEERAVIAPHIVEHVRDKITRNGDERNEMAFARWLARLDGFIHGLILGHAHGEMQGHVDRRIAAIGRPLLGDVLGVVDGRARNVFAGGQAQEAGGVFAIRKSLDVTEFGDEGCLLYTSPSPRDCS